MAVKTGKPINLPWFVEAYNTETDSWVIRGFMVKKKAEELASKLSENLSYKSVTFGWDVRRPKIENFGLI